MKVHVVIPAHNEAAGIAATISSVHTQTVRPQTVTVVADNCDDDTARLADEAGATVFTTRENTRRKAGALNQYLTTVLDTLDRDDVVLVMDADTRLSPAFVATATRLLRTHDQLGAVGGVFVGEAPAGWLEHCQTNEYARYARDVARHGGRVMVLTGTASAFRVRAMREVSVARGTQLPGRAGDVYDVDALTEDNEITLALKHLRWGLVSPKDCLVWTELMPTATDLHRQRLRWYRGAVDNLRSYGWTPVTARYWGQQLMLAVSVLMFSLLLLLTTVALATGTLRWSPWWSLVGVGFLAERVVSAWRTGSRTGRLLSAALFPELLYDLMLQFAFLRGLTQSLRGVHATWHHVSPSPSARVVPSHRRSSLNTTKELI